MSALKKICRLCLEKCENFEAIDENTKILLPKIDFTAIQEPVMCKICAEMVIKCFDFKIKCLRTHNYIVSFINKDNIELDLRDVYLSKNITSTNMTEDEAVCGLCMDLIKNCAVVPLDVEEKDVMLWKMIEQYLPELDLSIIKKAVICPSCCGSLEDCFRFVTTCLLVEQEIKKYRGTLCSSSKDQNELNNLDGNLVGIIKVEEEFCEDRKAANEGFQNKNESFLGLIDDQKVRDERQFTPNIYTSEEENNKCGSIKIEEIFCEENEPRHGEENLAEIEDQKFLSAEEIEMKTDTHNFNRFEAEGSKLHGKLKHATPNLGGDLFKPSLKQELTFQNVSEMDLHFSPHLLRHKDSSGVTLHECDSCSFQTRYKHALRTHLLKHQDPSEVAMYKCSSCSYQSIYKSSLETHLLVHKDPSEVAMHKCDSCSYQTRYKGALKIHMLKHKDPSEVAMIKCEFCSYQTKYKKDIKTHLLKHKDSSEIAMYKCDSCSYQTKYKYDLKAHLLRHKDPSEVAMYQCDSCSYQTRYKGAIKTHLLKHKDPSEVAMYKCYSCSYQTTSKCNLKTHLLKHKDPSEVTMYKCDYCSYQTKYKNGIKTHVLKHKDP